jgi:hypothetical protein
MGQWILMGVGGEKVLLMLISLFFTKGPVCNSDYIVTNFRVTGEWEKKIVIGSVCVT